MNRLIISCVLSVPFIVGSIYVALTRDATILLDVLVCIVVLPIFFMGFIINFKKILLGLITPIPILSYLIEWFKGMCYAVKAVIVIFKHKDYLKIGVGEAEEPEVTQETDGNA